MRHLSLGVSGEGQLAARASHEKQHQETSDESSTEVVKLTDREESLEKPAARAFAAHVQALKGEDMVCYSQRTSSLLKYTNVKPSNKADIVVPQKSARQQNLSR